MAITFSIEGDPVPQPRPRVTVRGKHGHAYTPSDHRIHAYRQAVALSAKAAGCRPHGEPAEVIIDAVFSRPKSHMNKAGVKPDAPQLPRADLDNVAKGILDSLNGVAWNDDAQVRRLVVEKSYGTEARTTVRIS